MVLAILGEQIGHFPQVIAQCSECLGCAYSEIACNFGFTYLSTFCTCNYYPGGNFSTFI